MNPLLSQWNFTQMYDAAQIIFHSRNRKERINSSHFVAFIARFLGEIASSNKGSIDALEIFKSLFTWINLSTTMKVSMTSCISPCNTWKSRKRLLERDDRLVVSSICCVSIP
ncbi:hypothetical protein RvY_00681 [Ramazzottius varieornatus]|uniref:Uncharacterized protein n=1 Tax=Ramazzottius varieornatus TaxID=947166 RepID=A0A1D1UNF3_RAMVA|nr:hypothetical protein RvY_00681 [Ramazzottius varieornatus]